MKTPIFLTLLALGSGIIAGCSDKPSRRYTVEELMADETLLRNIISDCKNNPGEKRDTPICVNAFQADHHLRIRKARENLRR